MKDKKQNYKKGDCILTEKPFAYVLKSKYRTERCDYCFKLGKVKKCSNCCYVHYCDRACQTEAWLQHKHECPGFKEVFINNRIIPDAAKMLTRIVLKLNNGGNLEKGYYIKNCYRKFRDLMTHYTSIKNDDRRMEHFATLVVILEKILKNVPIPNTTELLQIYGKVCINSFNILDNEMNSIGTGLYLGVSIVDHSCKPNAVAVFNGTEINVRITEDVPDFEWSKINISYIDLMNTPEERRLELKNHYYFHCTCTKCIDFNESIEMLGAKCPNCQSKVDLTSVDEEKAKCSECHSEIDSNFIASYNEVIQFTKSKLHEMKDIAYLDVCELCLRKQEKVLHKSNVYYVKTLDLAFESSIDMGNWEKAIEYGEKLIEDFTKYNGEYNPLLGLLYMKLSKILLYLQNVNDARKYLQESMQILRVTHGENHPLFREALLPFILELNMET